MTSKTAILGITRAVALETADADITCNAIAPGVLPTPAILARVENIAREQGILTELATRNYLIDRQPAGKFIPIENVGLCCLSLRSD